MIVLEPATFKISGANAAIRRRELSRFLSCAAQAIGLNGEVSVLLTGDERIRSLNREFRGKDKSTDVLSFPAAPAFAAGRHAGDLAISLNTASRQAVEHGHGLQTEVKILMLHGLLHLSGLDHESDSGQMARREARLRKQFDLPRGLIARGSPVERNSSRKAAGSPATAKRSQVKMAPEKKRRSSRP